MNPTPLFYLGVNKFHEGKCLVFTSIQKLSQLLLDSPQYSSHNL